MVIMLIGNKTDIESERVVSVEEGQKFADQNNLLFVEASAKNAINAFVLTARKIVEEIEKGNYDLTNENSGIKMGSALPKQIINKDKNCKC